MSVITTHTDITALDLECGHRIYLANDFIAQRRRDHKSFYCNVCGDKRHWPQKSKEEKLKAELASTKDQLETVRYQRDRNERRRRAEKAAKTRIKNRVSNGVCPCCNRTFANLARHMANKHPDYAAGSGQPSE